MPTPDGSAVTEKSRLARVRAQALLRVRYRHGRDLPGSVHQRTLGLLRGVLGQATSVIDLMERAGKTEDAVVDRLVGAALVARELVPSQQHDA